MTEVRYMKLFRETPIFVSPLDLEESRSLEVTAVDSFPHIENELTCIILLKLDPYFRGIFRIRIPETSPEYYEIEIGNPKDAPLWAVIQNEHTTVSFNEPGTQPIMLFLEGDPIHQITLEATQT